MSIGLKNRTLLLISLSLIILVHKIEAHGRLEIPASRNSAWRFGFGTPANYNDNEQNCGGAGQQHYVNGGRCGVCGDSYNGVRNHEAGGLYATGTIVKSYTQGQLIDVRITLSANHLGTMEFRLCPVNNKYVEATQECLNNNLLQISGYGTSYPVKSGQAVISLVVKLPDGISCSQCVFQWKYRGGNNWGTFPDGSTGLGGGPQEEFYNCADIEIKGGSGGGNIGVVQGTTTTSTRSTTVRATTTLSGSRTYTSTLSPLLYPFFHCEKIDQSKIANLPQTSDPNEFKGVPLCLLVGDSQLTCKDCYENCVTPLRQCPKQFCYCRWFV